MQPGLVSVVVPTYNRADIIAQTVDSILAQTYAPLEVIVVDDGSSDATERALLPCLARDQRVRYLAKPNGGVASARNLGIGQARGEFIAFCDSDDLWLPEKLNRQIPLFADPKVTLVYSGVSLLKADGSTSQPQGREFCQGDCFADLLRRNPVPTSTAVVRASALAQSGLFNERRDLQGVEDKHLWARLARIGSLAVVRQPLILYRLSLASVSSDQERMLKAELICLDDLSEIFAPLSASDHELFRQAYRETYRAYGHNLFNQKLYRAARKAFARARRLGPFHWRTQLYYWASFLPPALIERFRRLRAALVRTRS